MSLFSRLFGRHDWQEEANANLAKCAERDAKAVQQALANPKVVALLESKALGPDNLRALRSRLSAMGIPEEDRADEAIRNLELLDWFFSLRNPNKITLDESLQLSMWVRYGIKP